MLNDLVTIEELGIRPNEPVNRSTTLSNRTIVSKITNHKWIFNITISEMTELEFMALMAELTKQSGPFGEFQFRIEQVGQFNPDLSPLSISATASAGATSLTIAAHGVMYPGTFVKFSGHTKIYMITSATRTSIDVHPPLTAQVSSGEVGTVDQPTATVRNADEMAELRLIKHNRAQKYDLTLEEVI